MVGTLMAGDMGTKHSQYQYIVYGQHPDRFALVVYPLAAVADKRLQLELFDDELDSWISISARPRHASASHPTIRGKPINSCIIL